jgi:hypothetical protein
MTSPFQVSKFFCHFAFARAKEIDAAQVPRLAVSRLSIDPAEDTAIFDCKLSSASNSASGEF